MSAEQKMPSYYVMDPTNPNGMLLYSLPAPPRESWTLGRRFVNQPEQPIVAEIRTGHEEGELLPFFGTPQLMSDAFLEALREAGVDNLDTYEAVIRSEDGNIEHRGYKAFNLIGLVRAADLARTRFAPENPSRVLDASIEQLEIDESRTQGLLCFRLVEYTGSVIVHGG
jgi:hypothetical protein